MRTPAVVLSLVSLVSTVALGGCSADPGDAEESGGGAFSSNQATLLEFEFDAEVVTDLPWEEPVSIQSQLLYALGQLNANQSVGRLDNLELSNIEKTQLGKGLIKLRYHAKLPVAWGSKTNLPTSYEFLLPTDVTDAALLKFAETNKKRCAESHLDATTPDNMWYYFRPRQEGCEISEIFKTRATVTKSSSNTSGKYPEYDKVWEDDRLEVISIFGKYEVGAQSADSGIDAFNAYVSLVKQELGALSARVTSTPPNLSKAPGPKNTDVSFEATLPDGKVVKVTALLVDKVTDVPPAFDERYESLSPTADIIAYNGHSDLGRNVRALATKGRWEAQKYQLFFMNGCDSFAYVDGSLADKRALANPDDPNGTKYAEFITNAMPAFFKSMPASSMALMKGLLSYDQPKTYDQIFETIDRHQVVLVTGEEDNAFTPGMPIGKRR